MAQKIIVGCRLPHGLSVTVDGVRVTFSGASHGVKSEEGVFTPFGVNGCGITRDVDAEWFDTFLGLYAAAPYVQNGLIFQIKSENAIHDVTRERKGVKTGMEQVVPKDGDGDGKGAVVTERV